jgi:2,7-dihydroxy-5-methyl-1-naphthoate 7-O-methyltransferase
VEVPTAATTLQTLAGLATPMALRVAATLSLVERAGRTGATAERLASETRTAAPVLRRLLNHLVTIGVFELDRECDRYRSTNLGDQLREDAPGGIKLQLDINSAGGRAELAFVDLLVLMCFGGKERTVDELVRLAADCELVLRKSVQVADGRTLLEFGLST